MSGAGRQGASPSLAWASLTAILAISAISAMGCGEDTGQQPGGIGACLPHEQPCGAACVDVSSSAQHCGTCGVACAAGEVCEAGLCRNVCGAELGFCHGQCVSLRRSTDCGACGNACPSGQFCVGGACSATCAGEVCPGASGAECASLSDDRNHCGACNQACAPGDVCVGGRCVLDCGALTACGRACVDVLSDGAHCGECGMACTGGRACVQGACVCPAGLTACGDACVDTMASAEHCGGCDQACVAQGVCQAGQCSGPDGCTDTPVAGLALSAVDVYQSVQIPIMEEGAAVARAARNADVVAGRKALFRVHVTPEAGWTPRRVSARVALTEVDAPAPEQTQLFFAALTPTSASSDADLNSTFQVMAPAEAIGAATRYSVTLVECDGALAPPGTAATGARFPSTGYQPLEARETGPLKLHIVPIGSPGPDVSEEGLKAFTARLEAVYPITEVQLSVGQPLQSTASSMCSILASIASRRSQDGPPPAVYYYGLTAGILGGQSGCSNASPSAMGSKVSSGWAQGFTRDDGETGAATMCHELGHAHGRLHAPCNVQDPDRQYPYPNADIGVWAYDFRSDRLYEPTRKDMMSYCPEPRWAAWISDYNYQAILERVVAVNALAEIPALFRDDEPALPKEPWRLVVSDSAGVHWVEEPLLVRGVPEGTPVHAVIHGARGPMQQIVVYKQELHDGVSHDAFMLALPEPDPSWRAIEAPGLLALLPLPPAVLAP